MNRQEYYNSNICRKSPEYKKVQQLLKEYKIENNIAERFVVHHLDDTEECRKYNEAHYELWGFNEDGSFEYGKYVVFMSRKDHLSYHAKQRIGERNPFYRHKHSDEFRQNTSLRQKDKPRSATYRKYIHDISNKYAVYKQNGGHLKWNDFLTAMSKNEISLEMLTGPLNKLI